MSSEKNPEQVSDENGLDNWYGTPKSVGIRDYIAGAIIIVILLISMVIFSMVKEMKDEMNRVEMITCPHCNQEFSR